MASLAEKPSPAWQFTLIDSQFEGQREAAIREHEVSLTLVNVTFRNVPVGIDIDPDYSDWLFAKDARFENVVQGRRSSSAMKRASTPRSASRMPSASNTPVFARFRESGKTLGSSRCL